jgi:hypothetical protein
MQFVTENKQTVLIADILDRLVSWSVSPLASDHPEVVEVRSMIAELRKSAIVPRGIAVQAKEG